ncbi:MAG: c-type cytochrome [Anaerolineales bacterium]|jgi:nitric oxide reductase subunit C
MHSKYWLIGLVLVLLLLLAGCSSGEQSASNPQAGEVLFQELVINQAPGCVTCHSLEPGVKLVGPSLANAAVLAEEALNSSEYTGKAATPAEFIRESIVDPDAYVPDGYISGTMYPDYAEKLDDSQIDALVSYLLSLNR